MSLLYVDVVFMYQVEDHYGTSEYICHFSMSIFYKCKTWYVISVCQYLVVCHFGMSILYLCTMWYVITVCQYFIYIPCGMSFQYVNIFSRCQMVHVISVCQYFFLHACGMSFQCVNVLFTYLVVCHFSMPIFYIQTT